MSERELTIHVANALRRFAADGVIWFHVPNEGQRTRVSGHIIKRMGLKPGVADFCIIQPDEPHPRVWFLELKTETGRQTPAQKAFQEECEAAGVEYVLARGLDEALSALGKRGAIRTIA